MSRAPLLKGRYSFIIALTGSCVSLSALLDFPFSVILTAFLSLKTFHALSIDSCLIVVLYTPKDQLIAFSLFFINRFSHRPWYRVLTSLIPTTRISRGLIITTLTLVCFRCDPQTCSLPVWFGAFTSGLSIVESLPSIARYLYGIDKEIIPNGLSPLESTSFAGCTYHLIFSHTLFLDSCVGMTCVTSFSCLLE